MRVLQVLLSPRVGGAETLAAELAAAWTTRGVVTEIAYLDEGSAGGSRMERLRSLRQQVRAFRPDVLVAHSGIPNVYARLVAPGGVPVVTVLHSAGDDHAESRRLRLAELLLGFRTAHVVAVSRAQADAYLAHFPRRRACTTVVPNGVRAGLEPVAASPVARTVGVLARIDAQKRPDVWVRAAQIALATCDLEFHWWGPLASASELSRLLGGPVPSSPAIAFEGVASSVAGALKDLDVYFHTSDREAMSMSLLEAAVCGLPVVCSDEVARTLPLGVAADVFRAGDAAHAARALAACVEHFPQRARAARAMAPRVRSELGMEACAATYLRVFESVAGPRPQRWGAWLTAGKPGRRRPRVDTLDL